MKRSKLNFTFLITASSCLVTGFILLLIATISFHTHPNTETCFNFKDNVTCDNYCGCSWCNKDNMCLSTSDKVLCNLNPTYVKCIEYYENLAIFTIIIIVSLASSVGLFIARQCLKDY
jgi:hypothetical protein